MLHTGGMLAVVDLAGMLLHTRREGEGVQQGLLLPLLLLLLATGHCH